MLKIHHAGIHTSVQDAGRSGFRQLGVSLCGALDLPALRTANLLVGNDQFAAGLEVTLGNFVAEFTSTGWVALTGAGCEATLAGKPLWTGWCFPVKPGINSVCASLAMGCAVTLPSAVGLWFQRLWAQKVQILKAVLVAGRAISS